MWRTAPDTLATRASSTGPATPHVADTTGHSANRSPILVDQMGGKIRRGAFQALFGTISA